MLSEALFAALLDLLAGFGFAGLLLGAAVAVTALVARRERRLPERVETEPEPVAVAPAFDWPERPPESEASVSYGRRAA